MIISALLMSLALSPAQASDDIHCTKQGNTVANVVGFLAQYTPFAAFPREFDLNIGMTDIALKPNAIGAPITYQLSYDEQANQATLVNLNQVPLHVCRFANAAIDYSACYTLPAGLNAMNSSQALQAIRRHVETSPRIDMSQQTPYMGYSMSLYTWPVASGQNAAFQEVKFPSLVTDASALYSCQANQAISQGSEGKLPPISNGDSELSAPSGMGHGSIVIDQ